MNHRECWELLPWYQAGTLAEPERAVVAAHVASCAECAAELTQLAALRRAVHAQDQTEVGLPPDHYARLSAALDRLEPARAPAVSWRARLAQWLAPAAAWPRLAQVTVAAQFLLLVAAGLWLAGQYPSPASYTTAGAPAAERARVSVVFTPQATAAQIRELLHQVDGRIADGPSASGAYTVELSVSAKDEAAVRQRLERLRQRPAVVRAAERAT